MNLGGTRSWTAWCRRMCPSTRCSPESSTTPPGGIAILVLSISRRASDTIPVDRFPLGDSGSAQQLPSPTRSRGFGDGSSSSLHIVHIAPAGRRLHEAHPVRDHGAEVEVPFSLLDRLQRLKCGTRLCQRRQQAEEVTEVGQSVILEGRKS